MKRAHALTCLVGLALVACQDRQPPTAPSDPEPFFDVVDGYSPSPPSSDFFFRFPFRRLDQKPPATGFNPDAAPVVEIGAWDGDSYFCEAGRTCVADSDGDLVLISRLTVTSGHIFTLDGLAVRVDGIKVFPALQKYLAVWNTKNLGLNANQTYHLRVLVGGQELGSADLDVVTSIYALIKALLALQKTTGDDYDVPMLQKGLLPIPFWYGGTAKSETIAQGEAGGAEATTGDRVDLAAGWTATNANTGEPVDEVTVTVEECDGIDVDLPLRGKCLRATADPPLEEISPKVLVSFCSDAEAEVKQEGQEALFTVHQQDGNEVRALPHADPKCESGLTDAGGNALTRFARGAWHAVRARMAALFGPRPLFARSSVAAFNLGGGGETDAFGSEFQLALPAKMDYVNAGDADRTDAPGTSLVFAVSVTDARDDPVSGGDVPAHVTFSITEGGTTVSLPPVPVVEGVAQITRTLGTEPITVTATGRGIATPDDNGPLVGDGESDGGFDPFWPDFDVVAIASTPVELHTGVLQFVAAPQITVTLVSGAGEIGTRDPNNQFTLDGETFEQAFIIAPHAFYHVLPGTKYISRNESVLIENVPSNASTRYRTSFTLPTGFSSPSLTVDVHADNVATIFVNGTQIGQQTHDEILTNFRDPAESFTTSTASLFQAGTNVLRFDIFNFGGPTAFDYKAVLTYVKRP